MSEHTSSLFTVAGQLMDLSSAASMMGNTILAKRLDHLAETIERKAEAINSEHGKMLHQQLRDAEQSSFNLLEACLRAPEIVAANEKARRGS